MPGKIFLMRHAAPDNPNDVMYGNLPGFPLSSAGIKQAEEAGKFMSQYNLDLIVTSSLERAFQTGEIVAKFNPGHPEVIKDHQWREVGTDAWQGKTAMADWINNRMDYWQKQCGGEINVEHPKEVQSRVVNSFNEYIQKYSNKNILFVSHGDPLSFLIESLLGEELSPNPKGSFGKIQQSNIWEVELQPQVTLHKIFQPSDQSFRA